MTIYKAPINDHVFILHELLRVQDLTDIDGFENVNEEFTRQVLEGVSTFCEEVWRPLNAIGDEQGCVVENGVVRTPEGFRDAYRQYCEAGWNKLTASEAEGGAGLPHSVALSASEIAVSSNAALALYSGLTNAAHVTLAQSGSDWMLEHVVPKMVDGSWTGTMCLTEPHCGTDLRLMKTKAQEQPDGTFKITGTKIFISGGDHDLSDNIVHLVLAKLPNADGKYVDDLSTVNFFMVSKTNLDPSNGRLLARNGVNVGGVEKKMGIKGNATCVLNFDNAVAYRLAGRAGAGKASSSAGMAGMFAMMNRARLGTGTSALAVAEAAYQNGAAYARERIAGKSKPGSDVPNAIIEYPDVRRLLMRQRAFIDGARALGTWVSLLLDLERKHKDIAERKRASVLATLLTPVIKAYFSDRGFESTNATVQIFGGHGYIRDNGVEQFVRDSRIYQIYEGANGVQALDLVARKISAGGGEGIATFLSEIDQTIEDCSGVQGMSECVAALRSASETVGELTAWISSSDPATAAGGSYDVLNVVGTTALGLMWARMAKIARERVASGEGDVEFYVKKIQLAHFWMSREMPMIQALAQRARLGSEGLMDAQAANF